MSKIQETLKEIEELKGFSRCPDLWNEIRNNLNGNIGMKGVSDFSFTQIVLEAKDTTIDYVLKRISDAKNK